MCVGVGSASSMSTYKEQMEKLFGKFDNREGNDGKTRMMEITCDDHNEDDDLIPKKSNNTIKDNQR